jgi:hypothetical protein
VVCNRIMVEDRSEIERQTSKIERSLMVTSLHGHHAQTVLSRSFSWFASGFRTTHLGCSFTLPPWPGSLPSWPQPASSWLSSPLSSLSECLQMLPLGGRKMEEDLLGLSLSHMECNHGWALGKSHGLTLNSQENNLWGTFKVSSS